MRLFLATALSSTLLIACSGQAQPGPVQVSATRPFQAQPVADFDKPWAMTFLPDGRMLVTQNEGQLLLVSADAKSRAPVAGVPAVEVRVVSNEHREDDRSRWDVDGALHVLDRALPSMVDAVVATARGS